MSTPAAILSALAVLMEFAGIVAIAWPDLFPWMIRASDWLGQLGRRIRARLKRLLRRPPPQTSVGATLNVEVGMTLRGVVIKGPPCERFGEGDRRVPAQAGPGKPDGVR